MTLTFKDLKYGETNNFKDSDENPSADRRRTSTTTALRVSAEKAFEVNTLSNVNTLEGYVVGSRKITRPITEYKPSMIRGQALAEADGEASTTGHETSHYLYKVLIPELEPLPNPTSFSDGVVGLYQDVAIAPGLLGEKNPEDLNGAMVDIQFLDFANLNGPRIVGIIAMGVMGASEAESLGGSWSPGQAHLIGGSFETSPRKIRHFTWEERKTLYKALKPLFDYISSGEGNINSVNRGVAGDTPSKYSKSIFSDGKGVSERTIADVVAHYKGGTKATNVSLYKKGNTSPSVWKKYVSGSYTEGTIKSVENPGILAAGKYQWIPGTMRSTLKAVQLTEKQQETLIFNNYNQNIMATYLILDKAHRSRLGGYLLGFHDSVSDAGQELAKEFASFPNQFNAKHGKKSKDWICPRGYNHYCSNPKKGAKEGANAKFKPTRKTPEAVAQKLREAREAVRNNAKAVAIAQTIEPSAFTTT